LSGIYFQAAHGTSGQTPVVDHGARGQMGNIDGTVACHRGKLARCGHRNASARCEPRKGLAFGQKRLVTRNESLLCCLLRDTHRGSDLAPGGTRDAGLVDEVTDEGIGLVT
jgi:hypothetical protein